MRNDPVTQYARDVTTGKVVAARLVRLACARHLRDLTSAALVWRPDEAQDVIDFFATVLKLPEEVAATDDVRVDVPDEGTAFVLSPFQQFIVGSLFGWYTTQGYRRFRIAFLEMGKGQGKTPLCAGVLLYMLVTGARNAQYYTAAVTKDQAKLAYADCEKMVRASPDLRALIDQKVNNLCILATGSFIRPVSSEKRGLDGKRVTGATIDEQHEHPNDVVTAKIIAGTKGCVNALVMVPTNSGFDQESVCYHFHDYSRQVLQGEVADESWFAFVCHLDACERCTAAGKIQPSDDCVACDDWKTEGPHWLKACPNLGVSLPWEYVRKQVRLALGMPSQRSMVRRLNFCQWMQQATVFIPPEAWAACQGAFSSASLVGRECYLGIDLSDKIDLSAVVAIFPREMERAAPDVEQDGAQVPVDRALDVLPFFWMPKKSILRRSAEDKVPYVEWAHAGYLTATAGPMIDHDAIVEFIINVLAKKYQLKSIGIDQSGASAVITRLRREFGEEFVVEVPQGFRRLNTPMRMIEALVVSRNLAHDGNPVMAMCVGNLASEENSWREIRPVKVSQKKRIDGGVALIDAEFVMLQHPVEAPDVFELVVV